MNSFLLHVQSLRFWNHIRINCFVNVCRIAKPNDTKNRINRSHWITHYEWAQCEVLKTLSLDSHNSETGSTLSQWNSNTLFVLSEFSNWRRELNDFVLSPTCSRERNILSEVYDFTQCEYFRQMPAPISWFPYNRFNSHRNLWYTRFVVYTNLLPWLSNVHEWIIAIGIPHTMFQNWRQFSGGIQTPLIFVWMFIGQTVYPFTFISLLTSTPI